VVEHVGRHLLGMAHAAEQTNPPLSVRQIMPLLEAAGTTPSQALSRSTVLWLRKQFGLPKNPAPEVEERCSFGAEVGWPGTRRSSPSRDGRSGGT
jgi:hypothetical protein